MMEFDEASLQDKANAIVQRLLTHAIQSCINEFFGVRTTFGRVEVETRNRDVNSTRYFVELLMVKPVRAQLQQKFADQVMRWILRAPKTKEMLEQIVKDTEHRFSTDNYTLREIREKVREAVSTIAHEHAKEDFLAILRRVGDHLQKEVDTSQPAE